VVRLPHENGFAAGAISVVPGTVRLLGSRARVQAIDSVRTEPLEIERADVPVEETVRLDTASLGPIRVIPGEVSVRVDIEAVGSRTIGRVPIRLTSASAGSLRPDPEMVRVRVSGNRRRLAALAADSLLIFVDAARQNPGRVRLRVIAPPGVGARAEPDSVDLVRRSGRG
jgi:YbbR domain-containing protein